MTKHDKDVLAMTALGDSADESLCEIANFFAAEECLSAGEKIHEAGRALQHAALDSWMTSHEPFTRDESEQRRRDDIMELLSYYRQVLRGVHDGLTDLARNLK